MPRPCCTKTLTSNCHTIPGTCARTPRQALDEAGCFGTCGQASIGAVKSTALHFLILTVAGWLQRRREDQIEYLLAENAVYKEHFAGKRLRLVTWD